MNRKIITYLTIAILSIIFSPLNLEGKDCHVIIIDSITHTPLSNASIFNNKGNLIGLTSDNGHLPQIASNDFPVTVRYIGFKEKTISRLECDTILMVETYTELPEVIIESQQHKVLHILAYIREYSTLSTYTDSVFLFREKMVDYMLTPDSKVKFNGWNTPRILKSKSYYHFTNSHGLDSVSDKCNHHFSWSDWVGVPPPHQMASGIKNVEHGSDTLRGKYSISEVWVRNNDKVNIDINVLADTSCRKWVPNLSIFFRNNLDFENFKIRFKYDNVVGDSIYLTDLAGYSFNIESNGRGRNMFGFNHKDQPFYVNTYAEVYILDKEYITTKEAKKWNSRKIETENFEIIEPAEAPELQPLIKNLIARVNTIHHDDVRLNIKPDYRLMGRGVHRQNIGQRALAILKQLTGISAYKSRKNFNRNWNTFRKEQTKKNNNRRE